MIRPIAWAALALAMVGSPGAPAAQPLLAGGVTPGKLTIELPAPTGRFAVGTALLHLTDQDRSDPWKVDRRRELMVSIWYPATDVEGRSLASYIAPEPGRLLAAALLRQVGRDPSIMDLSAVRTHAYQDAPARRGRYPVVLYSPGGGQSRSVGTVLVEDLASQGYVVVSIDHTYEAPAVEFPGGRVEASALPAASSEDVLRKMIGTRVADARFVLEALERIGTDRSGALPRGLARSLDLSRIGMFGHSAGGFTAFETALADKRLDAVINLDGSMGYNMPRGVYGEVVDKGLDRPFMFIGASVIGPQRNPLTHVGSADWKQMWERSTGWKRDFYIATGMHMAFADHVVIVPQAAGQLNLPASLVASAIGSADPARMLGVQRTLIAAFFDQHLKDAKRPVLDPGGPSDPLVQLVP